MITKKICPECESENVELVAGGIIGGYMCKDCGFLGNIFPEIQILQNKKQERNRE